MGGGAAGHVVGGNGAKGNALEPAGPPGGRVHNNAGLLHKWTHAKGAPSHGGHVQGASKGSVEEPKAEQPLTAPHGSAREKQRQVVGDTTPV